jgi:Zn-dependent alcohol dehydrogenase
MRAAVLYEARTPMCLEDVSVDGPKDDEVLVQIRATGACHSDYRVINGSWNGPGIESKRSRRRRRPGRNG